MKRKPLWHHNVGIQVFQVFLFVIKVQNPTLAFLQTIPAVPGLCKNLSGPYSTGMIPGEIISRRYQTLSTALIPVGDAVLREVEQISCVYDPLQYARRPWEAYLHRFCRGPRKVLFLGMNPGPWGMAQTGVPFGEVDAVRDWMGLEAPVEQPKYPHPARPVQGFNCSRSEVSGRRLWGLMRHRFGDAATFFRDHAVLNYCPLVFMGESGRNITPDKLPVRLRKPLEDACTAALADAITALRPQHLVGIGRFAQERLEHARAAASKIETESPVRILHPSPASPAANRGWAETVTRQLEEAGIW